jgi:predicted dehydrogenase
VVSKILKVINRMREQFYYSNPPFCKPPILVGFIGQGRHAMTNLYPALPYANIEVVATCAKHNADYTDFRKMLDNPKIDAVIACVNGQVHYEVAKECAVRKLPLFVEKPPCETLEQAEELCELNSNIMVGFNRRFSKTTLMAQEIIKYPASCVFINVHVGPVGSIKNLLTEVGIHYYDLNNLFGGGKNIGISQLGSWDNPSERIEIVKDEDRVIIDNVHTLTHYHNNNKTTLWQPNYTVPDIENHLLYLNGYIGELRAFAKGECTPNIHDAYLALKQIEVSLEQLSS